MNVRIDQHRLGGPPYPFIAIIRDDKDSVKVLLYSHYTTITGWRGPPKTWGPVYAPQDAPPKIVGTLLQRLSKSGSVISRKHVTHLYVAYGILSSSVAAQATPETVLYI